MSECVRHTQRSSMSSDVSKGSSSSRAFAVQSLMSRMCQGKVVETGQTCHVFTDSNIHVSKFDMCALTDVRHN